jgi:hypothetical protein
LRGIAPALRNQTLDLDTADVSGVAVKLNDERHHRDSPISKAEAAAARP